MVENVAIYLFKEFYVFQVGAKLLLRFILPIGAPGGTATTQVPRDKKQEKAQEDLSKQLQTIERFVYYNRT